MRSASTVEGAAASALRGPSRVARATLVMVASGFAGLGYQIVWTKQSAVWLGHEAAAVLAVASAFFGGLAVGAWWLGGRIARSARPERWYAACELAIAAWSLILSVAIGPVTAQLLTLTGAQPSPLFQWTLAFAGTFALLLPATLAMGATLPAMERVTARLAAGPRAIAGLYAANTFGATAGVLVTAFWLVPEIGLTRTAWLCAALNAACALAALTLVGERLRAAPPMRSVRAPRALTMLATTGLLGIGYELLVVRVLSQVNEDTVYTFAILLAVYLVGTAIGAAAFERWWPARLAPGASVDRLCGVLAGACLLGLLGLHAAPLLKSALPHGLGEGMVGALAGEAALALLAFLLPTVSMGMLFSALSLQARDEGVGFGTALAVNTLGAAIAPPLFGVLLAPALGAQRAIVGVVLGYLALIASRQQRRPMTIGLAVAALACALILPPLVFVDVPEGGRIVSYREGALAAVSVVEDAEGVSRLRIDNRQQEGSSASLFADARQALLPVLLHPAPRRVLFLGLGTGVTASSAARDPALQVDAVELLPEVIAASAHFSAALEDAGPLARINLIAADARRYVRASSAPYDVIVSDNFHPARSGSASLYTVEHFAAVQARLAPGGVFCQWLPLHQLDLGTLRSIVRSFIAVHPNAQALLATNSLDTPVIGLIARNAASGFDLDALRDRLARASGPQHLTEFGLADEFALLGGFIAGPAALARFAADAPLNTDDRPVVAYLAPRITYAPDSSPRDRLGALLAELDDAPAELIAPGPDARWQRRLAAYWLARDRFIEAGRAVRPSADAHAMLAQVGAPLLTVLRISPDFRPAYDPLLRIASALMRSDPAAARDLLQALVAVQPLRPEAADLLQGSALVAR